jgi:fatty-acyl-CoA synthase
MSRALSVASPSFMAARFAAAIIRHDPLTQMPLRDAAGFCIRCARGKAGEAISRISADAAARFEGYTNGPDSESKVLRNVFVKGDAWFRTGDLMRRDGQGYFYFIDHIGDTSRRNG